MELSKAVRTGYFSALDGVISVRVFDSFAPDADENGQDVHPPYVIISSQTSVQRTVKRCKVYDLSVNLDIVTGSQDTIGMSQAEDIAEEIENIVNPDTFEDIDITTNGYRIADTRRLSDGQLTGKNDLYYIYRKIISYSHLIHKI